ncbi:hypothetical protein [Mucilaginibacter sp.]|uniref:hypothetical protein n=1 Tax=Mucilaginibacter sp. TaxID=1882438 RepID=UPI003D100A09
MLASRNAASQSLVQTACESLGAETVNAAIKWKDKIDIWINNAGILARGDFDTSPMAVHEHIIRTNQPVIPLRFGSRHL